MFGHVDNLVDTNEQELNKITQWLGNGFAYLSISPFIVLSFVQPEVVKLHGAVVRFNTVIENCRYRVFIGQWHEKTNDK